jgi:hypothetical protein
MTFDHDLADWLAKGALIEGQGHGGAVSEGHDRPHPAPPLARRARQARLRPPRH